MQTIGDANSLQVLELAEGFTVIVPQPQGTSDFLLNSGMKHSLKNKSIKRKALAFRIISPRDSFICSRFGHTKFQVS